MYSPELTATLLEELRTNVGDTSEGDFGYGTTNQELIPQLKNVRTDLRISCTWYLPASESVSVTSVGASRAGGPENSGDVSQHITAHNRDARDGDTLAGG